MPTFIFFSLCSNPWFQGYRKLAWYLQSHMATGEYSAILKQCMKKKGKYGDPMDCSLLGSSIHGILQARILEWIAIPFSTGSSLPCDWTWASCIAGGFLTIWATREAQSTACYFSTSEAWCLFFIQAPAWKLKAKIMNSFTSIIYI